MRPQRQIKRRTYDADEFVTDFTASKKTSADVKESKAFDKRQAKLAKLNKSKKLTQKFEKKEKKVKVKTAKSPKKKKASATAVKSSEEPGEFDELNFELDADVPLDDLLEEFEADPFYDPYAPSNYSRSSVAPNSKAAESVRPKTPKKKRPGVSGGRLKPLNQLIGDFYEEAAVVEEELPPSLERRVCASNATRLKNMLKLPKAHRWVFYEWFYSNLDRGLFLGQNDFQTCIRENFPLLKTRLLTRGQWALIRKLIGKPRRCSAAFFAEERRALHERRDKIRSLQRRRKLGKGEAVRELPDDFKVPLPLVIGTRVVARVRYPTDGLYSGQVDAMDTANACYRVSFDKQPLGTRSIPDYEVRSVSANPFLPLSSYKVLKPPKALLSHSARSAPPAADVSTSPAVSVPPMVAQQISVACRRLSLLESESYGEFSLRFLLVLVRFLKLLERKKACLASIEAGNTRAERLVASGGRAPLSLLQELAGDLTALRQLNLDLSANQEALESFLKSQEDVLVSEEERMCVDKALRLSSKRRVGLKSRDLIGKLLSLLALTRVLTVERRGASLRPVYRALAELKASVHHANLRCFEDTVEVHLRSVLGHSDVSSDLHAFQFPAPVTYM